MATQWQIVFANELAVRITQSEPVAAMKKLGGGRNRFLFDVYSQFPGRNRLKCKR